MKKNTKILFPIIVVLGFVLYFISSLQVTEVSGYISIKPLTITKISEQLKNSHCTDILNMRTMISGCNYSFDRKTSKFFINMIGGFGPIGFILSENNIFITAGVTSPFGHINIASFETAAQKKIAEDSSGLANIITLIKNSGVITATRDATDVVY